MDFGPIDRVCLFFSKLVRPRKRPRDMGRLAPVYGVWFDSEENDANYCGVTSGSGEQHRSGALSST